MSDDERDTGNQGGVPPRRPSSGDLPGTVWTVLLALIVLGLFLYTLAQGGGGGGHSGGSGGWH
ncbi:hypothetical protein ACFV2S_37425 [Streptomyces sp. NPDC059695]|uniref:hypothetical protein n=1 Tax=Streptomyces sp. NPDC059695 TaxID=3346910 RepID=UPI00367CFD06